MSDRKTITYSKPEPRRGLRSRGGGARGPRGPQEPLRWTSGDPDTVHPATRGEVFPLASLGVILAFVALAVCYRKEYLLLYGDAVAHLGIARRILDSHYPGLAQLGGVWLPLPHILMLPFIGNMTMWQTGLAAVPMSMLSFALSVAGVWRLARRMLRPRWAFVATAFYALNPNLLYLSTTAMTEPLFLALFVWSVVAVMEGVSALRDGKVRAAQGRMLLAGLLVFLQVFTRYDGWIIGAVEWLCFAVALLRVEAAIRRRVVPVFAVFTAICLAGPLLWFWYNAHFEHDWLDFMRGPYSAAAIERKTAPPGQHYRGWHNMGWAVLFYTRTAQVDAAVWETGFALMLAAIYGLWLSFKRRAAETARAMSEGYALLLWAPLPFYVYSIAYGSVPIFIPQLWPHSFYNARYGMEMLPALSVYAALAAERLHRWMRDDVAGWGKMGARIWESVALVLCVANAVWMMYAVPSVLKEGIVNARTRVAFEKQLAEVIGEVPETSPVMMSVNDHIGAVQTAGRNLRDVVSEQDGIAWNKALSDPAHSAAFVISLGDDEVARAVRAHPAGLNELEVIRVTGQPTARVYHSTAWKDH